MSREHLLPDNRTAFEEALSTASDYLPDLLPGVEAVRGFKFAGPFPAWLGPALIFEYGLGDIVSYFVNADAAVSEGVAWQRIIGTAAALTKALSWIGYEDILIRDAFPRRRMWHRYQIGMGEVPAVELPRLLDAEYLAGLSDPARSIFFRGWHGYDVRALEWSGGRWSRSMWGDSSGVRLDGGQTKWSHGEDFDGAIVAGAPEREALGIDVELGEDPGWIDIPWDTPGIDWSGIVDVAAFKSFLIRRLPAHVGFFKANGDLIGMRRPIAVRDVTAAHDVAGDTIVIEVEVRTGFGDGEGRQAAAVALIYRAGHMAKPGALWVDANDVAMEPGFDDEDMTIGSVPVDFTFRRTVRQHVTLTLEI
jgi:hypothetical protein